MASAVSSTFYALCFILWTLHSIFDILHYMFCISYLLYALHSIFHMLYSRLCIHYPLPFISCSILYSSSTCPLIFLMIFLLSERHSCKPKWRVVIKNHSMSRRKLPRHQKKCMQNADGRNPRGPIYIYIYIYNYYMHFQNMKSFYCQGRVIW